MSELDALTEVRAEVRVALAKLAELRAEVRAALAALAELRAEVRADRAELALAKLDAEITRIRAVYGEESTTDEEGVRAQLAARAEIRAEVRAELALWKLDAELDAELRADLDDLAVLETRRARIRGALEVRTRARALGVRAALAALAAPPLRVV